MITIIKKTIDEIKKAEKQAQKTLSDGESKKEQLLSDAREAIAKAEEQQKKDLAKLREQKIDAAKTKAKADSAELLERELARVKEKQKDMEQNVDAVKALIVKEFKKVIQ